MIETILKRFEQPDEVRNFEKGKFELVNIGGMTIGRATYSPGWKMVRPCWQERWEEELRCGAYWHRRFGSSYRRDG